MISKLQALEDRYEELAKLLSNPDTINDQSEWQKHAKAHASLTDVVNNYREYKKAVQGIKEAKEMLEDKLEDEFRDMVQLELEELKARQEELEKKLTVLLLPKDPNDEKNVIMEIRGGAGGEEAALFASELFRMYTRYAETKGWRTEVLSTNATDIGGIKEISFVIEGQGAYSRLKFESGVHRVQRVPATESSGRIHTSTVTVAVLPEAEEVDIAIDPNELRIDVFCSSGPGGQSVNTTQSAVRITHIPSGLVVSCQDEKSQHKNKDKAMRVLRSRLMDIAQDQQNAQMANARKSQVGTGDRSERIRTYNFPQGRVTDHRIGLTLHKLAQVLEGDLVEVIEALITTDQAEKLKQVD